MQVKDVQFWLISLLFLDIVMGALAEEHCFVNVFLCKVCISDIPHKQKIKERTSMLKECRTIQTFMLLCLLVRNTPQAVEYLSLGGSINNKTSVIKGVLVPVGSINGFQCSSTDIEKNKAVFNCTEICFTQTLSVFNNHQRRMVPNPPQSYIIFLPFNIQ